MEHFDSNFFRGAIPSYLNKDEDILSEPDDLNLDLSGFMDEEEPNPLMFNFNDEPAAEILMDERNSCCHRDNSDKDYDGNESTFISYLPEPE
jgi:hypothetical protein